MRIVCNDIENYLRTTFLQENFTTRGNGQERLLNAYNEKFKVQLNHAIHIDPFYARRCDIFTENRFIGTTEVMVTATENASEQDYVFLLRCEVEGSSRMCDFDIVIQMHFSDEYYPKKGKREKIT